MTPLARVFLALCFAALAACAPGPVKVAPPTQTVAEAAPADPAAACAAKGGRMEPAGRRGLLTCAIPFADAGKACQDDADCEGRCLARGGATPSADGRVTGACQATSLLFGCFTAVENGKAGYVLCVD